MDSGENENKRRGKMADYLANERTFLAWIRTGIATISLGFVIARFNFWLRELASIPGGMESTPSPGISLPVGLAMVAFGGLMTLFAAYRYRAIQRAIELDLPHPRSMLIDVTTAVVVLLALVMIIYLLVTSTQF